MMHATAMPRSLFAPTLLCVSLAVAPPQCAPDQPAPRTALASEGSTGGSTDASTVSAADDPANTPSDARKPTESAATPKPKDAVAERTMKTTNNPSGGYAVTHEPSWAVQSEGPSTVLMPSTTPADPANPEFYGLSAVPWNGRGALQDPANTELAVRELLADAPGLRRDGAAEKIDGGGILVRCSGEVNGRTMRLLVFARTIDSKLIGLVVTGDDATIEKRAQVARTLYATLRKPDAAAMAAKGAAGAVNSADLAFAGRWSTEEVLSSGGGFDFGGSASMVTQRILDLGRDGRFTFGSRSAGGGSGNTFESGLSIDAQGTWSIERTGGATMLVLRGTDGRTERIRCTIYEGQLVVGESGARKFYSRIN